MGMYDPAAPCKQKMIFDDRLRNKMLACIRIWSRHYVKIKDVRQYEVATALVYPASLLVNKFTVP